MIDDDEDDFLQRTSVQAIDAKAIGFDQKKQNAFLIVLGGRTAVGKMFRLTDAREMIIGRVAPADIVVEDDGVSRKHAKIVQRTDGDVELVDLNSTNGTFLNGERIASRVLRDGDKIQVGSTAILKFSYQDALDEAMQKNLYESATRDGLTRLYNKKYLLDALDKEFAYALRHKIPLSLLMLDVDFFKKINDTYGHLAGDFVLQKVAGTIGETVRAEDMVARYGGEEFSIILRETPEPPAVVCGERVRSAIQARDFIFNEIRIPVTISVGVATLVERNYLSAEMFIAAADKFLYAAKQGGRNRVVASIKAP